MGEKSLTASRGTGLEASLISKEPRLLPFPFTRICLPAKRELFPFKTLFAQPTAKQVCIALPPRSRYKETKTYVHAVKSGAAAIWRSLMTSFRNRQPVEYGFARLMGRFGSRRRKQLDLRGREREGVEEEEFFFPVLDNGLRYLRVFRDFSWNMWETRLCLIFHWNKSSRYFPEKISNKMRTT